MPARSRLSPPKVTRRPSAWSLVSSKCSVARRILPARRIEATSAMAALTTLLDNVTTPMVRLSPAFRRCHRPAAPPVNCQLWGLVEDRPLPRERDSLCTNNPHHPALNCHWPFPSMIPAIFMRHGPYSDHLIGWRNPLSMPATGCAEQFRYGHPAPQPAFSMSHHIEEGRICKTANSTRWLMARLVIGTN